MSGPDYTYLPTDLPRPADDGGADHLVGALVPEVILSGTLGDMPLVADTEWTIVYVYPRTGGPGITLPTDWDSIPGARGCTPQSCAYRDHHAELTALGASVRGLGAQPLSEQVAFSERMHIPFPLLNDEELRLHRGPPRLPVFAELGLYRRLTMAISGGRIRRVWYPVFPPDRDAEAVIGWLTETQGIDG